MELEFTSKSQLQILILLLSISFSCVSNKVTPTVGLKLHVPPGSSILFDNVQGLSNRDSELFYKLFSEQLDDCYSSQYVSYLDFELRASGIDPTILRSDSSSLTIAGKVAQADFILFVSILGSGTSPQFHGTNPLTGQSIMLPHKEGATYFEIVSLRNFNNRWAFSVETNIAPFVYHGSAVLISTNLSNENNAIRKSFSKGLRELESEVLKNCE